MTDLATFYPWVKGRFTKAVLYLKGGDLKDEIAECSRKCRVDQSRFCQFDIAGIYDEEYFAGKKIVVISA